MVLENKVVNWVTGHGYSDFVSIDRVTDFTFNGEYSTLEYISNFYTQYFLYLEKYLKRNSFNRGVFTFNSLDELSNDLNELEDTFYFCETFVGEIKDVIKDTFNGFNKNFNNTELVFNILDYNLFLIKKALDNEEWNDFISYMVDVPFRIYEDLLDVGVISKNSSKMILSEDVKQVTIDVEEYNNFFLWDDGSAVTVQNHFLNRGDNSGY